MSVEHAARSGADSAGLMVSLVAVAEKDATDMSGFLLQAPPHPGEAGAGANVRRDVGGAVTIVSSFPSH